MPLDPDIIQAFHRSGLTQGELAKRLGVRQPTVSDWLNGKKTPRGRHLEKLRATLGLVAPSTSSSTLPGNDRLTLIIYSHLRPGAGNGHLAYQVDTSEASTQIVHSKRLFHDLLGFWPPDDMRGVYMNEDGRDYLVLYEPVTELISGQRYIMLIEDKATGDWPLAMNRVQVYAGGGLKFISDNPGLGLEDEKLIPDDGGHLIHQATGLPVRIRVIGRVLWPLDEDEAAHIKLITRTIERLSAMGWKLTG